MKGPDHASSINYKELNLSNSLKKTSLAFGSFKKKLTVSEKKNKKAVRKSYYFKNDVKKYFYYRKRFRL